MYCMKLNLDKKKINKIKNKDINVSEQRLN